MEEDFAEDSLFLSSSVPPEQPRYSSQAFPLPFGEGGLKRKQSLDPVQKARNADSQRSRLIFGPKHASGLADRHLRDAMNIPRRTAEVNDELSTSHSGGGGKILSSSASAGPDLVRSPSMSNSLFHSSATTSISPPMLLKRSGRSLHQRFNASDADVSEGSFQRLRTPAPQQSIEPIVIDASVVAANPSQIRTHANFTTSGHSRSASVVSSVLGRQDEDISSIMMRGATDLRHAKFELEEQRREIAFLQSQLDNMKGEKEESLKRLQTVKDAAKLSLEKNSKSLDDLEAVMNELKMKSRSSFEMITKAQSSLPDVQELRDTISEAMRSIEPLLDENGLLIKHSETRHLVGDLQLGCQKAQEVADMLRDKLTFVGSELVDSRNRVMELESANNMDRAALRGSSQSLNDAGQQLSELAETVKKQQNELYDILSIAAEADTKLSVANERIAKLTATIEMKDCELEELRSVKHRNDNLANVIADRDAKIGSLAGIAAEVNDLRNLLAEKEQSICALNASFTLKEEYIEELKSRIGDMQTRDDSGAEKVLVLTGELRELQAREAAAVKEVEGRASERQQLLHKISSLEQALEAVKMESDIRNERLHEANTRWQVLEERFEEQSITLRVTRESNGDLQERLITAEAAHARAFESATGDLKCDIALLKEQNAQLQNIASQLDLKIKGQEGTLAATVQEHEGKQKNQEELYRARIDAEEKRASQAEYDLAASRTMVQSLQATIAIASAEVQDLREQVTKAMLPDPTRAEEIAALKAHVQNLEKERNDLYARARTIEIRYKQGDLNEEEKNFINTLVQTSQAIHEQELITKGNDLRRRDNTIKELRAKVHVLESTLAKHLKAQAQAQAQARMPPPTMENRSMINPAAWTSSDPSSSPPASGPQAPDRDVPESTNVDITVMTKSTPAPSRNPELLLPAMPLGPVQVTPVQSTALSDRGKGVQRGPKTPSAYRSPAPDLVVGPTVTKPAFGRLAMESSDEIAEFQVPLSSVLRKRDAIESPPPRAADSVTVSKPPLKRLRTSTRKADERASGVSIDKPSIPASASKTRSRKRR